MVRFDKISNIKLAQLQVGESRHYLTFSIIHGFQPIKPHNAIPTKSVQTHITDKSHYRS